MNYAYWFANIPGLSNCAKISIHEKVGNAQDIYFLSEKQMENMQLLAKEIQAVRAAQKTDMEEASRRERPLRLSVRECAPNTGGRLQGSSGECLRRAASVL